MSGKKTLAEFLHRLDGQRRAPPAVISCAAVGDHLFDSRGWQEAHESGTAIIEGVEQLPFDQQERLATALAGNGSRRPLRVIALSSTRLDEPAERSHFSPALYQRQMQLFKVGEWIDRDKVLRKLVSLQYERNDTVLSRGKVIVDGGRYLGSKGDGRFVKRGLSQYLV